jgi:hypothetical protein
VDVGTDPCAEIEEQLGRTVSYDGSERHSIPPFILEGPPFGAVGIQDGAETNVAGKPGEVNLKALPPADIHRERT